MPQVSIAIPHTPNCTYNALKIRSHAQQFTARTCWAQELAASKDAACCPIVTRRTNRVDLERQVRIIQI